MEITFGQLFTAMHPDVRAIENGSCVWLFIDEVNHYTIATEWWNQEVTDYAALKLLSNKISAVTFRERKVKWDDSD